jgi:TRAP-type C4-dicarboxylate transport system permease small subunit
MAIARRLTRPINAILERIESISMAIAGVCFAAIAVITAIDVVMRYALNAPLVWAYELISDYLMVAIFFLAIGATQRRGQNIGVDILARRLPDRARAALAAVSLILMIVYVGLMGHAGWGVFLDAWDSGDVLAGVIPWPRWPALILVPIGAVLLLLRLIADLIANLGAAAGDTELATHRRAQSHRGMGIE